MATNRRGKRGVIGVVTTETYRKENPARLSLFVREHLYWLCVNLRVLATGGTFDAISTIVNRTTQADLRGFSALRRVPLAVWRRTITDGMEPLRYDVPGVIELLYELVVKRVGAIIHLAHSKDLNAKIDSAVIWRESNVHKLPVAHDIPTAAAYIAEWARVPGGKQVFPRAGAEARNRARPIKTVQVHGRGESVLALVAHDRMKIEMTLFFIQHMKRIANRFAYVLATGTTGSILRRAALALGQQGLADRVLPCLSGPDGGDIQIAYAVLNGWCKRIAFFQDPLNAHPHETDIRLFEQACLDKVDVRLATNPAGAAFILQP